MISERVDPITIINGVTIKKCDLTKVNYDDRFIQQDPYEDSFKEVREEHSRILNYRSKPCPHDFPEKLKPYWKGHLEFSLTPCQSGWIFLEEQKKLGKKKDNRN